jgi:hypothetical protein
MKTTIYLASQFRDHFAQCGREDQFSYEGLGLLFDYFEEYESATGEELELDVISVCCDYTEETVEGIARNYSIDLNDADPESDDYEDQCRAIVRDYLESNTTIVGETASGFVYANF